MVGDRRDAVSRCAVFSELNNGGGPAACCGTPAPQMVCAMRDRLPIMDVREQVIGPRIE